MPKLCAPYILLKKSAVGVIVGWIAIHPLVEPKGKVNPTSDSEVLRSRTFQSMNDGDP